MFVLLVLRLAGSVDIAVSLFKGFSSWQGGMTVIVIFGGAGAGAYVVYEVTEVGVAIVKAWGRWRGRWGR